MQRRNSDVFSNQQENYGDIDYSKTGLHDIDLDEFNKTEGSTYQDMNFGSVQAKSSVTKSSLVGGSQRYNSSQGSMVNYPRNYSNGQRSQNGFSNENRETTYPRNPIRRDSSAAFQERMIQDRRETPSGLNKSFNSGSYQSK